MEIKKKLTRIFFLIFLVINSQISFAQNIIQIPNDINMNISWKSLKRYYFYLDQLKKSFISDPIPKEFKKNFNAKVFYESKNNETKILPAKTRITGDILDHIDTDRNLSSFKIELEKGNINNITKFRLLTDKKSHNDEIFWSILIRELGFPSSSRGMVNSKINGMQSKKYFFEESYSKEFIERIGLRNSPVVEMDDREKFYIKSQSKECYSFTLSGYKANLECINKFKNKIKKINIYKIENKSFIQNPLTAQISYKAIIEKNKLNIFDEIIDGYYDNLKESADLFKNLDELKTKILKNKNFINYKTFSEIHKIYGSHALNDYNIKFIFDPMFNELIPVNWDSNIRLSNKCSNLNKNFNQKFQNNELNKKFQKINYQYTQITNSKKITKEMECLISLYLSDDYFKYQRKIDLINNFNKKDKKILDKLLIYKTKKKFPIVEIKENFKEGKICYSEINCNNIGFEIVKNVLGGDYTIIDDQGKSIFPYLYLGTKTNKNEILDIVNKDLRKKLNIYINENTTKFLNFNNIKNVKKIDVILENPKTSRLVIHNSNLKDMKINVTSKYNEIFNNELINQIRHDEALLTGCLTIINSHLGNLEINFNYSNCEDAINFIRTNGNIKNLKVQNSQFDAIDADSSNIIFENIEVENALNDCLDFSFGNYLVQNLKVTNCGDKGLSVGEKSSVNISNFDSIKTNLSFVSKDSSILHLNKFSSDFDKNFICGKAYKKKQEFDGAEIILNKKINCKVSLDKFSKLTTTF